MITRAGHTVLDLSQSEHGIFKTLKSEGVPSEPHGVPNLEYLEGNYISVSGGYIVDGAITFSSEHAGDGYLKLGASDGDLTRGPHIGITGDGAIAASGDLYLSSGTGRIHLMSGSMKVGEATEALCINSEKIESRIGALILRSPDIVGSPDPSPYILLESLAPGEPQALGGSLSPAIVLSNPDAPAQSHPYQYTKISNRDGTILQIEGDNAFSDGQPVSTGTPLFAIMQNAGVYLDLFGHVLKRVGDPVGPEDGVNKRYVDEFGGSVTTSSSYGPTGYAVFKGGLTMQWGIAPEAPEGAATVTLPIAWNTGFMVGFCAAEVSGGDTKVGSVVAHGTSQVTITYNKSGSPVTPSAGSWIAFGY